MRHSALRLAFLLLLFTPVSSPGQTGSGSIQGTVKDSTGAVVPGVTATITHAQTSRQYTTTSTDVGFYLFPSVQLGQYEITFELPGMASSTCSTLQGPRSPTRTRL